MMWDLEERVEDAFVAYLQRTVTGDMRVYAGFSTEVVQYPCAIVHVAQTQPVSEPAEWHNPRQMTAMIAVRTEAAAEITTTGATVRSARERNAAARSDVMSALATSSLVSLLAAVGTPGVQFSMAQVAGVERSVEERTFVSVISVEVIAEPVEVQ